MKSWQLTVSDVLSVGAIYNETTKLYNAVMNNKVSTCHVLLCT